MTQPVQSEMTFDEFLNSGGGKSFKFKTIGEQITGKIAALKLTPQKEYDPKTKSSSDVVKTDKNGKPVMQAVITLENTGLKDPTDPDDDGRRNVYIASWRQRDALAKAVRAAGERSCQVGAQLTVKFTGEEEPNEENADRRKAKFFEMSYVPAGQSIDVGAVSDAAPATSTPAASAPATTAAPAAAQDDEAAAFAAFKAQQAAAAQAAAPAPAAEDPAIAALRAQGLTDEQIAAVRKMQGLS